MSVFPKDYRDIIPIRFLKVSIWGNSKKTFLPVSEKVSRKYEREHVFYTIIIGINLVFWIQSSEI